MNEKLPETKPQIKFVENVVVSIDKTPLSGVHVMVHKIPLESLAVIAKILEKPVGITDKMHYVECAKARDGTKLFFVGDTSATD